jgi:hypothetical protein
MRITVPYFQKAVMTYFWKTNKETTTGRNRIRGQLPEETVVAHKTGWSGTNKETGITAAVNNIGIVFLPSGEYFIISVFVSESKEAFDTNEKIIADIAKATYEFYTAPIYNDVKTGWCESATGWNYMNGLQAGYSFKKSDVPLNIRRITAQDVRRNPLIPLHLI